MARSPLRPRHGFLLFFLKGVVVSRTQDGAGSGTNRSLLRGGGEGRGRCHSRAPLPAGEVQSTPSHPRPERDAPPDPDRGRESCPCEGLPPLRAWYSPGPGTSPQEWGCGGHLKAPVPSALWLFPPSGPIPPAPPTSLSVDQPPHPLLAATVPSPSCALPPPSQRGWDDRWRRPLRPLPARAEGRGASRSVLASDWLRAFARAPYLSLCV